MKPSSAALLLASISSLASASPVKSRQATDSSFFTITAARSGSPIHQQSVHASGRAFWIGKPTETYCPPQVDAEAACPPGTETVLALGESAASLDVAVPGGQQIYVEPTGALGFTQAHSVNYPPGSTFEGFTLTPGSPFGSLGFSGLGATGFLACPADGSGAGPYKVFADVEGLKDGNTPGGSVQACIGFDALAVEYTGSGSAAWQYV
ncbi:hypothetical protein MMC29_004261 [Sticta canariensis]|nr:hypothetical protein [Sticta canariensis]